MKKMTIWLGMLLPWISATVLLVVYCVQAYLHGLRFTQGMHVFRWLFNLFTGAWIYTPTLVVGAVVAFASRQSLRARGRLGVALFVIGTSILVPLIAFPAMSACFYCGRAHAYERLDYAAIYKACSGLGEDVHRTGTDFAFSKFEGDDAMELPQAIALLSPLQVHVTRSAAVIQMDGGGPMYHEGIGVILSGRAVPAELEKECKRLDAKLPVFLYRLSDYRIFLDKCERSKDEPK